MKTIKLKDFTDAKTRREFLEKKFDISLENIAKFSFAEEDTANRNIENLIGAAQIPLGVAGPVKLKTKNSKLGTYYIPLATTEGALVASISRGCKVIESSGGAKVFVENVGMSRGPVFKCKSLQECMETEAWIEENLKSLAKLAESTSSHLKLLKAEYKVVSKNLFVRLSFDTEDAMGMNMVTIATEVIVQEIEKKTNARCVSLAGNFDVDKKPSWLNFIEGRGKKIWAEVVVPKKVVSETLKTTPEKIVEVVKSKTHLGSIMSGSLGFNSHFANIIAAIFIATGQDPAHVVEGSMGVTDSEVEKNGDLYFSIYLPSLIVGVVGGGTSLPTQKEALKILGVKNSVEFSGVIAHAILAGELSLIASLAQGSLATAHQKLGRKGGKAKSQI